MANLTDTMLELGNSPGAGPIAITPPEPEPRIGPASQIDPTLPVYGNPTTESVRANFATAQTEITGLMQNTVGAPFLRLAGGNMTGPMYLYNDPTDVMMPVTLGYFETHGGGGGSGSGGVPEAPTTTNLFYVRGSGAWVPGLALAGGSSNAMTGELWLAGDPVDPLGAVTKQYADVIKTTANGAVPLAGNVANPMTGLLILSGDPTAALGAVTKQYADNALALKANAANPTFTGIVTVASSGRVIVQGPTNPSVTLYNTTSGQPVYGIYNSGGYLSFGLAVATTGNPNGAPFMVFDQLGNCSITTKLYCTGGRIISSSNSGPSITLNNTTMGNIFGLWGGTGTNNLLNFGLVDANGNPQTTLMTMDGGGNVTANSFYLGNGASFYNGGGGNGAFICYTSGQNYYFTMNNAGNPAMRWGQASSGDLMQCTSSGQLWVADYYYVTGAGSFGPLNQSSWPGGVIVWEGNHSYQYSMQARVDPAIQFVLGAAQLFNVYSTGNIYCMGTLSQGSDATTKTDIEELTDTAGLDVVRRLVPKRFRRLPLKDVPQIEPQEPRVQWGFVAQDVEPVIPEAVTTSMPGVVEGAEPTLGIEINAILAAVTLAVKQIDARLTALEGAH